MESISTAKTKDQPPQHYIFIILFIGLAVMAIIGGIGYHFLFRKPKNENQKQTSLLDDGTLHDDSYHQVI
jgi:flagellar basal body-associated protein FliL